MMIVRRWLPVLTMISSLALYSACNESTFSGDQKTKSNDQSGDGAGGPGGDLEGQFGANAVQKDAFQMANVSAADILFIVDTSKSMLEEKGYVETNMKKFIDNLIAAQLDAKIQVMGKVTEKTDSLAQGLVFTFPAGLPADRFAVIDQYIHSTDAIGHLSRLLNGQITPVFPLRAGVGLEVIIITDDDGSNVVNNPYNTPGNTSYDFKKPDNRSVTVNAIVGMTPGTSATNPLCTVERRGTEALRLVELSKGSALDLCEPDWSKLFQQLTDKIIERNSGFKLSNTPDMTKPFEVFIDNSAVDPKNYTVEADNRLIKFVDAFAKTIKAGADIRVSYIKK